MKKYKLREVATVDISGVDKKIKEDEQSIRLCNFTDVYYNWAITLDMRDSFLLASAKSNEISRFLLKRGQVAFTKDSETRDDIGMSVYIADDFEDVLLGYHCAIATPNPSKLSGKYLNAFMHSNYIRRYFMNSASGSGQRYSLSQNTLSEMPLLLPSILEQECIGNLFSLIDQKIRLNRSLNHNLPILAHSSEEAKARRVA